MGKLFGTNGIRGVVGQTMTADLALGIGQALGTTLEPGDRVLVGRDPRTSGPMLQSALVSGLLASGVDVADAGVTPTPALQLAVKHGGYAAGVVLTASHNPPEFNGIKVCTSDGTELFPDEEAPIEHAYLERELRTAPWREIGSLQEAPGVNDAYVDAVVSHVDAAAVRDAGLRIVVDCSNGAGCLTAPWIYRRLGCEVVTLNAQPDGTFPGHPSEPTPENVRDLVAATTAFGADLGIVHDGDADRAIFVTEEGTYLQGDRVLALVAGHVVAARGGGIVVTPVSSSSAVEEHVEAQGGEVDHTAVGSPVVARRILELGDRAVFGGEENGGLVFPEHQIVRDGSMTAAKVLEILATSGRTLSELVAGLPRKATVKLKTDCPEELKQQVLDAFADAHAGEEAITLDGVKLPHPGGWVLVRPSGTEPIVRVYAEADDQETAAKRGDAALREVEGIVAELGG